MAFAFRTQANTLHLTSILSLVAASLLTACGGGGANSDDDAGGVSASNKYQFTADFINLIPTTNAQLNSKVDLFYQHIGIDEVEIVSNIDYLNSHRTANFGWTGLPQANLSFIVKDAFNNQSLISTSTIGYSSNQGAQFLLATGEKPSTQPVSVLRINKLSGDQGRYRLFHGNALDSRTIDIYNADAQTPLALNLAFNQLSSVINYDQNVSEINIFAIASGTSPDYSNTSNYLFQQALTQGSTDHLSVLVAKPGTSAAWQITHYSE